MPEAKWTANVGVFPCRKPAIAPERIGSLLSALYSGVVFLCFHVIIIVLLTYTVTKKTGHSHMPQSHNCRKYWPISIILSLSHSQTNCIQRLNKICQLTSNLLPHYGAKVEYSTLLLYSTSGPALGMFEVFGRTGPQNLRGPQFRTLQKLTCQFERLWMMFIWRKLPTDSPPYTRFDLSLDWLSFCRLLQWWPKNQKCCVGASRCVLKAFNTAKCDCGGAPPRTPMEKLTASPRTHGGAIQRSPHPRPTQNFGCVGHNAFGRTSFY